MEVVDCTDLNLAWKPLAQQQYLRVVGRDDHNVVVLEWSFDRAIPECVSDEPRDFRRDRCEPSFPWATSELPLAAAGEGKPKKHSRKYHEDHPDPRRITGEVDDRDYEE